MINLICGTPFGDMKWLITVSFQLEPYAYARSLARYAANLGPVAWNVSSRKLKSARPNGLAFGPGWVGERVTPPNTLTFTPEKLKPTNGLVFDCESRQVTPSTSGLSSAVVQRLSSEMIEAVRRLNCQNELAQQELWTVTGTSFEAQDKSVFHPNRNGFKGMFGFGLSAQMGIARPAIQAGQFGLGEGWISIKMLGMLSSEEFTSLTPGPSYQANSEEIKSAGSWGTSHCGSLLGDTSDSHIVYEMGSSLLQVLSAKHTSRVQASGSPSSRLQIGSPQQLDLALQL